MWSDIVSKNDNFEKVNEVIKTKIKPRLAEHFGDIELKEVSENIAKVKFLGACGSCPSARDTLENIVLAELQKAIPELKEVTLETQVNEDLIDMAKRILNRGK